MIDFLEASAVDQFQNIGDHGSDTKGKEYQPPWRAPQRAMDQERRIGGALRHRSVHVVDCEIGHARPSIMAVTNSWSAGLSTSTAASGLLSSTLRILRPSRLPTASNV